jgi:hypothetical protein
MDELEFTINGGAAAPQMTLQPGSFGPDRAANNHHLERTTSVKVDTDLNDAGDINAFAPPPLNFGDPLLKGQYKVQGREREKQSFPKSEVYWVTSARENESYKSLQGNDQPAMT